MGNDFNAFMEQSDEGKKKVAVGVSVYPNVKAKLDHLSLEREIPVSAIVAKMIDFCLAQAENAE